jgi:hypothetical protein
MSVKVGKTPFCTDPEFWKWQAPGVAAGALGDELGMLVLPQSSSSTLRDNAPPQPRGQEGESPRPASMLPLLTISATNPGAAPPSLLPRCHHTSPPHAGTMVAPAAAAAASASASATATTAAAAVNPGAPAAIAATTPPALLPPEILVVLPPLPPLPRQVSTM